MVSVVTVCRNCLPQLRQTIKSVDAQRNSDYEHIIVDGASSDGTPDFLAREFRGRWISEPDGGIYDAMNKGVGMAGGEWVIFMNAGDTFADAMTLHRLAPALSGNGDVVYGDVLKEGSDGTLNLKKAEKPHSSHRMIFCHQSALVRRPLLMRFPFDVSHPYSADFKFFKILWRQGYRFLQVDFPVAVFDTTGVSNRRRSAGLADNLKVICETDGLLRGLPHLFHLLPTYLLTRLRGK